MKKNKIREILAVMGVAVALTACGQSNAPQSEPAAEETQQEDEADSKASGEDAGDETSADDTNDTAASDVSDGKVADEPAGDETSLLDDGLYITVDNFDQDKDPDAEKDAVMYKAEVKDGVLAISASLEQRDENWDQVAYYTYETREIPVAKDLVIGFGGAYLDDDSNWVEDFEEITVEEFNSMYADPNASDREIRSGLGIDIEIEDGEVTAITMTP